MDEREMLTDERIKEVVDAIDFGTMVTADDYIYVIARAIEREVAARRTTPDREAWQPIETAPKDRTIQLWVPAVGIFVDGPWRGRWSYAAHQWVLDTPFREPDGKGVSVSEIPDPTHWMPLPTIPTSDKGGAR